MKDKTLYGLFRISPKVNQECNECHDLRRRPYIYYDDRGSDRGTRVVLPCTVCYSVKFEKAVSHFTPYQRGTLRLSETWVENQDSSGTEGPSATSQLLLGMETPQLGNMPSDSTTQS